MLHFKCEVSVLKYSVLHLRLFQIATMLTVV